MSTIQGLMAGIVDYAGLFPPANLEMTPMVRNYAEYRDVPEREMLARIIVPVSRFTEFQEAAADLLTPVPPAEGDEIEPDPWAISALVAGADNPEALARDIEAIHAFNDEHTSEGNGAAIVDTIELRATDGGEIDGVLEDLDDELYPYFELNPAADIRGALTALVGLDAGAKIRTGGITAEEHPSATVVAEFIVACQIAQVPFKATAGLHHPITHFATSVNATQLGFINVFLGACLLHAGRIKSGQLVELLSEEDAAAFNFGNDAAGWKGHSATLDEIETARWRFAHSFGSCSFAEPLDELRKLGLIEKETTA